MARVADPEVPAAVDLVVPEGGDPAVKAAMVADLVGLEVLGAPVAVEEGPVVDAAPEDLVIPETNHAADTSRRWLAAPAESRRWSKVVAASRSALWEWSAMVPARWEPVRAKLARFPLR